jgi:multiple sugar transport system substrate-binding protein
MSDPRSCSLQNEEKQMKKRTKIPIAGASLVALALGACAPAAPEPTSSAPGPATTYEEPVDLTMTVWTDNETVIGVYQELADRFREDNPELGELTIVTIPFADYVAQLTIQLSGGNSPDLGWIVESTTLAWVDSGALADISALKSDPDWDFEDINPGLYAALEGPNGELYGYPFANTTQPVIYNKTVFEEAGVDSPLDLFEAGNWTWDELRRISKEIVDSGSVTYGFDAPQFSYTSYAWFIPFMKAFGATSWPDGTACGYNTPEALQAFEFLHGMVFDDGSFPKPGSASSFATGDTAMVLNPPSLLNTLGDATFEFDMVPQPTGTNGFDPFFGQAHMVVWADGAAPELATRLLGYFSSELGSSLLQNFFVPPRQKLLTPDQVAKLNPLLTPEAANRALVEPLSTAVQIPYPVEYPQLESALRPILDGVWLPNSDIKSVVAAACEEADRILGG